MKNNPEVNYVSETEIWVGDNKTSLINENTIYVITCGEQTTEIAIAQTEVNQKFSLMINGGINFLIDLNKCGKNSSEARLLWKQIPAQENTKKIALFGLHPVAKLIASFVMGMSKSNKERFFSTKEQALAWLLE
jgi:hypothetical protein